MSIINKLASSLKRRDEVPNQELAHQILKSNDQRAVKELVDNLSHNCVNGSQKHLQKLD